jgi:uncharacterized membrane protein YcaP (DUF421 family)
MEIIARATVIFAFLWLLTRGMKRRSLAELGPLEVILLVVMGDLVQQGITQEDMSLTGAVLAVSTMAFWVSVLMWLSWRSDGARKVIEGVPLVVVRDGKPIEAALRVERLPLDEVMEAARQQGIATLDEVTLAVLEPSGNISVIGPRP